MALRASRSEAEGRQGNRRAAGIAAEIVSPETVTAGCACRCGFSMFGPPLTLGPRGQPRAVVGGVSPPARKVRPVRPVALDCSSWVLVRATECPSDGRLSRGLVGCPRPLVLQLRYWRGKRVAGVSILLGSQGRRLKRRSSCFFDWLQPRANLTLGGGWCFELLPFEPLLRPSGGSQRAFRAEWGALGAFWVQSVLARRYCASGSAGGTQSAHCGQKLVCWAFAF